MVIAVVALVLFEGKSFRSLAKAWEKVCVDSRME
jgi:hypothetical protein